MLPSKNNDKEKIWFIIIENRQEGPFSILDLKNDHRFTPDTLVWKVGFKEWMLARNVKEIASAFKDEPASKKTQKPFQDKGLPSDAGKEVTLTLNQDPYQWILWILIFLLIIFYVFFIQER